VVGIPVLHLNDPDHQFAWSIPDFRALLTGFFPRHTLRGMREPDSLEVQDERAFRFAVGTGYLADGDRKELVLPSPLRLHLGCGRNRLPGFLNVDIVPGPAVDLVADSQRLPLLAGSVHEIATFHMTRQSQLLSNRLRRPPLPRNIFFWGFFRGDLPAAN